MVMTVILACVLNFDLFTHPDRSVTYDGRVHITTIAMYHDLLAKHEFPILWVDSWGNYGYPLGLVSCQVTSYLGAALQFIVGSPTLAFNWLFLLTTILSGVLMYLWLRLHLGVLAAIVGEVVFLFTPYHVQNIYVRGALPEYVSTVCVLFALLGIGLILEKKRLVGHLFIILGVASLALTHPMMLVPGAAFLGLYGLLLCLYRRRSIFVLISIAISALLGLGVGAFYVLPLLTGIKFFYYGTGMKLRGGEFVSPAQLLSTFAPYFSPTSHPGPPAVSIRLGVIESVGLAVAGLALATKDAWKNKYLIGALLMTLVLLFFTLPISRSLFEHIQLLGNLQYPWRFLSVASITTAAVVAVLIDMYANWRICVLVVVAVLLAEVPTAYGKNYLDTPSDVYQFTVTNLHTKNMAPIWAGESADYPVHREKVAIIDGLGTIHNLSVHNRIRAFDVDAKTPLRMVDYTFFFQGWKVYVDGVETLIEFQDPAYRGVITYQIPSGTHHVEVKFIATRTRKIAAVLSAASGVVALGWIGFLLVLRTKRQVR